MRQTRHRGSRASTTIVSVGRVENGDRGAARRQAWASIRLFEMCEVQSNAPFVAPGPQARRRPVAAAVSAA